MVVCAGASLIAARFSGCRREVIGSIDFDRMIYDGSEGVL
jgi:hypothetical protein